jgi:LacI family transcriptional regulator
MVTLTDVAKNARVSPVTVSRALNQPELVRPETRERVLVAVKELGYIPDAGARSLAAGRTQMIALILSDIRDPYFTTVARGVEDIAQEHGYTLVLCNTDEQGPKEHQYLSTMISRRVDGVLLSTSGDGLELLQERDVPFVLIDRKHPRVPADVVTSDSYDGGRQIVQHLLARGYRKIGFVGGPPRISTLEERLAGYRDAVRDAGLKPLVRLGRYDRTSGEEIVEALIAEENMPQALVAANSAVARGVITALRRNGLEVPNDVGLTSFGDVEADAIDPFLTVVSQPAYEIGRKGMELLLARFRGDPSPPVEIVLPVSLIVRRSTPGPT